MVLAPHADSICSANVPNPPAAAVHQYFFSRRVHARQSGAADCKPHCYETIGKCCQRLKISVGRGAQYVSGLDQYVTGLRAVGRCRLQSVNALSWLERGDLRSRCRDRSCEIVTEHHWKLAGA